MAKRNRQNLITASFHYLIKTTQAEDGNQPPTDQPFSKEEFQKVVKRISNTTPLDDKDENVISNIKIGIDLPFTHHEIVQGHIHFGQFEGAYYGQEYRNNRVGTISAESLNLRKFYYLTTLLADGRILIGVTYHGQFGDYDGLKQCFSHILKSNMTVTSRTIKSVADDIGAGEPVEVRLTYRRAAEKPESRSLFGHSGAIAIKATEYGDGFGEEVARMARNARGALAERKKSIAKLVNDSDMIELEDDDIISCTAIVREHGRNRTVYFLGENNFATKYLLEVPVDGNGFPSPQHVRDEMIGIMRKKIIPLISS